MILQISPESSDVIATGSFFLGQVMPAFMHGSPVLVALGIAPLPLMIFWLVRVRFTNRFKPALAE